LPSLCVPAFLGAKRKEKKTLEKLLYKPREREREREGTKLRESALTGVVSPVGVSCRTVGPSGEREREREREREYE
jgi:hypothetical protein